VTEAIGFHRVTRAYGALRAVDDLTLSIEAGEFFSLLGPSGSGKTTCLRLIAGFELPDAGSILLEGRDVSRVPPYARNVNTVFQDYALFPHLSVLENVCYGPRVRGMARAAREAKAREMLELVRLADFAARRPAQLSGGQRQRVALARALVNEPRVLLLDEPLGALDLKLREAMQAELRSLQRRLGITFVYVTHDQGEALSMSDRVAVFNAGRIEQLSTPQELYTRPRTAFVARFVGGANVLSAELSQRLLGSARAHALRAEDILLLEAGATMPGGNAAIDVTVEDLQYHGATSRWLLRLPDGSPLSATLPAAAGEAHRSAPGTRLLAIWSRSAAVPLEE
jgi:putative spermidine/putrescine transport system ATP-binding protein